VSGEISPAPTAEEAVAIVAAVEALWPKPVVIDDAQNLLRVPAWRFSGRWWRSCCRRGATPFADLEPPGAQPYAVVTGWGG
jgi:hypothetical protein